MAERGRGGLAGAPGVGEVAVAGVDDPEWGRRVVAWVVPAPGTPAPTLESLRDHAARRLPRYAGPAGPKWSGVSNSVGDTPAGRLPDVSEEREGGRKLLLLDGHSLAYRAFFALPDTLVTSAGQLTNAVYGFTSMLIKLLGDERPQGIVVCFDRAAPTFRDERYAEYKAGRAETPDSFREQLPLIREVLKSLRIPIVEMDGFEADDLLATLARRAKEHGDEVVVVTGDRDCLQLVGDDVAVMMTRRGISDIVRYDREGVIERYGVPPERWTDFAALKGETSDNLPGVPGVGDKTAAKLLAEYGDVEGVIAHADELRPKIRDALLEMADQVRLNKELGHLVDDAPVEIEPDALRIEPWDDEEVRSLFSSLEFRTLYERLQELELGERAASPALEVSSMEPLADGEQVPATELVALAWDGRWCALSAESGMARTLPLEAVPGRLGPLLTDASVPKAGHDAKSLFRALLEVGDDVDGLACDTQIAAYLLEPGTPGGYALPELVRRYLAASMEGEDDPAPKKGRQATLDLEPDDGEKAATAAVAVRALAPVLLERLEHRGMRELAATLEFPLVGVLARMEHAGIAVDRDYLEDLNSELGDRMQGLERRIWEHAGEEFNVNSNPQLQQVLFERLDLPKTKKIKTGYSTDHAELLKLQGTHPIVDALIEYREVAKLKTGFTDSLLPLIDPKTGRIHTTYSQVSAATGRLASTAPNMQNIPIRGELGRQIRRAFIAPPGYQLVAADYSQIELRVLAHLSGDEAFLEAFASGHDFHRAIAAKVYGVPVEGVEHAQRDSVKQFSYGIAYGMSPYGVSQRLGIEIEDAQAFIDAYYEQFPKVKAFLEAQVAQATTAGFTTTMFGRRRYLPELHSSNYRMRALGERMALNAPIQGSAADIIKKAMIDVDAALRAEPVARMLLSVHDELVFEVPDGHAGRARELVRERMEGTVELRCGIDVEVHSGPTWSDAHA